MCRGQIVWLKDVINSFGSNAAGPHMAAILAADLDINEELTEEIFADVEFLVSMISTKDYEPRYLEPVPPRLLPWGVDGKFICNWRERVLGRQMKTVIHGAQLVDPELLKIERHYQRFLADLKAGKVPGRSTQS
jgi:hypothetical protein